MAYCPDAAFNDIDEVGQKAFLLYAFYCKHGGMQKNVVTVGLEIGAKFIGVAYDNATRLNAKLKKAGWIRQKNGVTILIKGYEHLCETDENVSLKTVKATKLTKTSVLPDEQTDENISFDEELTKTSVLSDTKTDENVSFEVKTDESINPENDKTDENVSRKLTFSSVAYKEEPASFNQQEKEEEKKRDISSPKAKKLKNFTLAEKAERLFDVWKKTMKSKRSIFTKSRKELAVKILVKISYRDCLKMIYGCEKRDWNMGRDPNNQTLYNEFERIFKNVEAAEKFIGYYYAAQVKAQLAKQGGTNGFTKTNGYQTTADKRDERAVSEYQFNESVRARVAARRQQEKL